jgi:hypothetical protein
MSSGSLLALGIVRQFRWLSFHPSRSWVEKINTESNRTKGTMAVARRTCDLTRYTRPADSDQSTNLGDLRLRPSPHHGFTDVAGRRAQAELGDYRAGLLLPSLPG